MEGPQAVDEWKKPKVTPIAKMRSNRHFRERLKEYEAFSAIFTKTSRPQSGGTPFHIRPLPCPFDQRSRIQYIPKFPLIPQKSCILPVSRSCGFGLGPGPLSQRQIRSSACVPTSPRIRPESLQGANLPRGVGPPSRRVAITARGACVGRPYSTMPRCCLDRPR